MMRHEQSGSDTLVTAERSATTERQSSTAAACAVVEGRWSRCTALVRVAAVRNGSVVLFCRYCGAVVRAHPGGAARAKYCSVSCWSKAQPRLVGPEHPNWRGDAALTTTKRARIQRALPLGPCERCGGTATDRHHKDGDTGHNDRSNIAILCRRCHMTVDGRLWRCVPPAPPIQPERICINCGALHKPSRKGRCRSCAEYFYAHGTERPPVLPDPDEEAPVGTWPECQRGHLMTPKNTATYRVRRSGQERTYTRCRRCAVETTQRWRASHREGPACRAEIDALYGDLPGARV